MKHSSFHKAQFVTCYLMSLNRISQNRIFINDRRDKAPQKRAENPLHWLAPLVTVLLLGLLRRSVSILRSLILFQPPTSRHLSLSTEQMGRQFSLANLWQSTKLTTCNDIDKPTATRTGISVAHHRKKKRPANKNLPTYLVCCRASRAFAPPGSAEITHFLCLPWSSVGLPSSVFS